MPNVNAGYNINESGDISTYKNQRAGKLLCEQLNIKTSNSKTQDTHTKSYITSAKRIKSNKNRNSNIGDSMQNRINNKDTKNLINNRATNKARYANIKVAPLQKSALQRVMWLLAFITLFVLALQPVLQNRGNIAQAGGPTSGTGYTNAPATQVGGGKALFIANNSTDSSEQSYKSLGINPNVLFDLFEKINDESVWGNKEVLSSGVTYLSAKDFGQYDPNTNNAQIILKLLGSTSTTDNDVDDAANQYWQVVYRSVSKDEDVLTLYMTQPYKTSVFETNYYEGNYSVSNIRTAIQNTYSKMAETYSVLDEYVVAPYQLSSSTASEIQNSKNADLQGKTDFLNLGGWQSSAYQTSANSNGEYYNGTGFNSGTTTYGDHALGSSGYGSDTNTELGTVYNLGNGLDGLSVKYKDRGYEWESEFTSAYNDKMWLPSAFEVLYTGYAGESHSTLPGTERGYDGDTNTESYVDDPSSAGATLNVRSRSGLWELNGYDRAWGDTSVVGDWAWLRSGVSGYNSCACSIDWRGSYSPYAVNGNNGLRVALHLNLKELANAVFASVSADASAGSVGSPSVSFPDRGWEPTIESKYSNLIIKNSSESSISATYSFNTNKKMTSFTLNGEPVTVSGNSGRGSVSGVCDYSYQVGSGNVVITISNASQNVNIEAQIDDAGYALTFDYETNGGTSTTATNGIYVQGATVDLSNMQADKGNGWEFEGWSENPNAHSGSITTFQMPGQATTLYAIFSKTLTASFYQINTSSAETRDVTIYNTATNGNIIDIPVVNTSLSIAGATNITAVGWVKDDSLEDTTGGITISEDVAYYARVNYTITITYNGNGGSVSQASSTGTVTMTANGQATGATPTNAQIPLANNTTPRPNYTFVGWNSNSGGTGTSYTAGESYSFSASTTLYAVWDKTTTTAQLTITLATPSEAGVIIYLVQDNKVAKQFVVMGETKTISVELTKGAEYKIIVSKPYTWQVEYTGNGSVQNDNYVFTASSADVSETQYTITVSGGSIPNNWWIV